MKIRSNTSWPGWLAIAWVASSLAATFPARAAEPAARTGPSTGLKVPVALSWGPGGTLYAALRDARRVVAVDPRTWTIANGWDVLVRPASLVLADDRATLLLGGIDGHVVVLDSSGRVVRDLPIGRGPTRILPLPEGRAAVATRWNPLLRVIDWRQGRVLAEHALRFAPGALARRPDGRVVVADAFGDLFADLSPGIVGSERTFVLDGVNLLSLAISGDGKELF